MTRQIFPVTLFTLCLALAAGAQTTTFTYQGSLTQNGAAVTGPQDFEFRLFNAASGGVQIGSVLTLGDVGVTNGLFTVPLDFGAAFDGAARFLELTVRPGASTGAYTNLAPRQPLTSTPYAVRAANFSGAVADNQLSSNIARLNASATFAGPVSFSNTSNQFNGTFSGNGAGVTNLNLSLNSHGTITWPGSFLLASSPNAGDAPYSVTAADVNGDGTADLISAIQTNKLTVLTNNGSGGFVLSSSPGVGNGPISVTAADLNGDGKADLISANSNASTLSVLFNVPTFTGNFSGNGTGLRGVDAELLDGFDGSAFARLAADQNFTGANMFSGGSSFAGASMFNNASTFNGNVAVGSSTAISFGAQTRQMLNLWGAQYGIGVQTSTLYFRTDGTQADHGFAWFKGGTHADSPAKNPGAGGTRLMALDGTGLTVNGTVTATAFNPSSDRNLKENFATVSSREVLDKVAALPISRWNFKGDATPHVGPMAQDFHAAFGLGTDDKHIATVDADGVALAAIQGLNQKVEEATQRKDAEIAELAHQNAELLRRLEALEQKLR